MKIWPFDVSNLDLSSHCICWHAVREEHYKDLSLHGRQNYYNGVYICLHPLVPCRFAQGPHEYGRYALCAIILPVQSWQWNLQLTLGVQEGIFRASVPPQWIKEVIPFEQLEQRLRTIPPVKSVTEGILCAYSPHSRISGYGDWLDESTLMAQCRVVLSSAQSPVISRLAAGIYCCYSSPSLRDQVYPAVHSAMVELLFSQEHLDPGMASLAIDILDQGGVPDWENLSAERGSEPLPFERRALLAWRQSATPWSKAIVKNLTRNSPEQYSAVNRLLQIVNGTAHDLHGSEQEWLPALVDILTCGHLNKEQANRVFDIIDQCSAAAVVTVLPTMILRSDSIPSRVRNRVMPLAQQYRHLIRQELIEISQCPIRRPAHIAKLTLNQETSGGDKNADRPGNGKKLF